ncbi:hypothetical protein P2G88_11215 [Aliiglaciecola sp. CAU 1673]|uniref:hypothetical protein n=1 Tax=Aliiglaciecola sp. CAU 1673 TaxID=3032595 RepID=UPI0023DBF536|nr:hypothetical protein [Aliiglaciecola sp. CAU 1673]MDF2178817.1 hypothetical protein [Aliiglaciecola sp. CAU 1673]
MTSITSHYLRNIAFGLATLALAATQMGCMQSSRASASDLQIKNNQDVSENTLAMVNRSFKKDFIMGEWRYRGAQAVNGGINAYFQVPSKLDMSQEYQENYLRQAICPSAQEKLLWQEMQGLSLSVHIYTFNKRFSVHAECPNPLLS